MKINRHFDVVGTKAGAFSLIEAIIGLGLIGTTGVALLAGISSGFFTMRMARENLRATQILLEKVETIRLYNWDQVNTPGFIPENFSSYYDPTAEDPAKRGVLYTGTMTVTPVEAVNSSYSNDLRLVTVTLNWKTGTLDRQRTFSSYISRYGMQDYIY